MGKTTPTIFVSHASADRVLAIKLKAMLQGALGANVFCSSDVGDIEGGKPWFQQIMTNLKLANVCVAVITPNSLYFSPWVAYEAGGAYLRFEIDSSKSRLFPVSAYGLTPGLVPSPFNHLQVRNLANAKEVKTFVDEIAKSLGARVRMLRGLHQLTAEAAEGSPHWGHVSLGLVGDRQEWSPFNFLSLLQRASAEIFCAGLNLNHIARTPEIWQRLLSWLKASPNRVVRLLIADEPSRRMSVQWQSLGKPFLADLRHSARVFRSWKLKGEKLKLLEGQLDIRRAPFVTLTVLAIDPDLPGAEIVLTPAIFERSLSPARPHFWLSRARQPQVFAYYWDTYRDLFFNRGKSL